MIGRISPSHLLSVALVAAVVTAGASLAGGRSAARAGDGLVAFAVDWPQSLHGPTDADEITQVICGVDLTGKTYRLTQIEEGAVDTSPAWSPDGGRLAFAAQGSFDEGISVVTPPSMVPVDGPTHASSPAWSPSGTQLAFQSPPLYFGSLQNIWIASVDGSGRKQLTSGTGGDDHPTWSPDGVQIAFESAGDIQVINVDGSNERNLTRSNSPESAPDWSPDGRTLVFVSGSHSSATLELMATDGTGRRELGAGVRGDTPTWSPDGDMIAFNRDGDVRVVRTDGSGERVLFRLHAARGLDWQPVAHPEALAGLPPCAIVGTAGRHTLTGSGFADVIYGTDGADRITGEGGDDLVFAYGGADRIFGGPGADQIDAGAGNDVVDGGPGNDLIVGGPGADRLIGGSGRDRIEGGPGNDTILSRDGQVDSISCGPGRDLVLADRIDRVARDCEHVERR